MEQGDRHFRCICSTRCERHVPSVYRNRLWADGNVGSVASLSAKDFIRNRTSAGRVLSLVDLKVDAPPGEAGEIMVRGPMLMKGYWNRTEDTAAVLSAEGWFRTGDIGRVDEEGYVFIVDRKKDMVISGGENIYCAEVERVIGAMAGVHECAAFGITDERLGELLVTVAVASGVSEDAIKSEVGEKLARYKAPGKWFWRVSPCRGTLWVR
ncbi:MAG: AMP-binding protein [Sphingomonadales bacterium]|nr:AMP-binding protein [Sphingomonadales bacterium]